MGMSTERKQALKEQALVVAGRIEAIDAKSRQLGYMPRHDQAELDDLHAQAKQLKTRLDQITADEEAITAIEKKFAGVRGPSPSSTAAGRPQSKSGRQPAGWVGPVEKQLQAMGAKSLTPTGSVLVPSLSAGLIDDDPNRPTTFLSRITFVGLTDTSVFEYMRVASRDHNAATVEKGTTKPTSAYSLERVQDRVHQIAHLSEPINRADLADIAMLQDFLEGEMVAGVELELERQVVAGNGSTAGTLDDMVGIFNTSGIGTQAFATDIFTTARKAVTQLELARIPLASVSWVMTPDQWEEFELTTAPEQFMLGSANAGAALPVDRANRRLWGLPVDTSTIMTTGQALLADWSSDTVEIREREGITLEWSEGGIVGMDGDTAVSGWQRNQVQWRAEGRWGLAVKRPGAMIDVTLVDD